MGFFSQLEQYASSHHWRPANLPQFEGREHKHCTVWVPLNRPSGASKGTVTGEAGQRGSNPKLAASPEIGAQSRKAPEASGAVQEDRRAG